MEWKSQPESRKSIVRRMIARSIVVEVLAANVRSTSEASRRLSRCIQSIKLHSLACSLQNVVIFSNLLDFDWAFALSCIFQSEAQINLSFLCRDKTVIWGNLKKRIQNNRDVLFIVNKSHCLTLPILRCFFSFFPFFILILSSWGLKLLWQHA